MAKYKVTGQEQVKIGRKSADPGETIDVPAEHDEKARRLVDEGRLTPVDDSSGQDAAGQDAGSSEGQRLGDAGGTDQGVRDTNTEVVDPTKAGTTTDLGSPEPGGDAPPVEMGEDGQLPQDKGASGMTVHRTHPPTGQPGDEPTTLEAPEEQPDGALGTAGARNQPGN